MSERSDAAWLVCPQPRAHPRLRLFCFPYAGGGASLYRSWGSLLPQEIEVCAVQLPGRENRFREPPFTQLAPLVENVAHVLRPAMAIPFAFFGYSLGTLISFELTRYLRRHNRPGPVHLFAAAYRAPQLPPKGEVIHTLQDAAFFQALQRLGGTPEAVLQNQELMHVMSPMLRADFQIYETYEYKKEPPLACPITAFGGTLDHEIGERLLLPWREQTSAAFQLYMLEGNHFFLHNSQEQIARIVYHKLQNGD